MTDDDIKIAHGIQNAWRARGAASILDVMRKHVSVKRVTCTCVDVRPMAKWREISEAICRNCCCLSS